MAFDYRPTTATDEKRLIEFLAHIFDTDAEADFVRPSLLRWKYWEPRDDFQEPRSFVIERSGRIAAHIGLWPVTVHAGAKSERGVHIIDWAADPEASGSGVFLLQRMTERFDFVYAIGGSKITQSILPKFGFRAAGEALLWARPIRPLRQILKHQGTDWRLPLRLARNAWWSSTPLRTVEPGWSAVEINVDGNKVTLATATERGESFFRYMKQCPTARCRIFRVLHNCRPAGLFVLSEVWEQTRVAGVWLEDSSQPGWRAAFQLAQDAALKLTNASEIIARSGTQDSAIGAEQAGLRLRAKIPVFSFRKDGGIGPLPLQFHLLDNDAFFLGGPSTGFAT